MTDLELIAELESLIAELESLENPIEGLEDADVTDELRVEYEAYEAKRDELLSMIEEIMAMLNASGNTEEEQTEE